MAIGTRSRKRGNRRRPWSLHLPLEGRQRDAGDADRLLGLMRRHAGISCNSAPAAWVGARPCTSIVLVFGWLDLLQKLACASNGAAADAQRHVHQFTPPRCAPPVPPSKPHGQHPHS